MRPLLTGSLAGRARDVTLDVAAALRDPAIHDVDRALHGMDVGRGGCGAAVLFAELAAETGDESYAETALSFLDNALEQAGDERPNALLYPGTVGVGWTMAYLEGRLLDEDPDDNDVDALVARALELGNWPSNDLIRGVAGVGVYLLERRRPSELVARRLEEMAVETPDGTTWHVHPATVLPERAEQYPDGYYDTGMAHGQAGVVAMLAHYVAAGVESARPLLEAAVRWLVAQRLPGNPSGRYPSLVPPDGAAKPGSRVAWCYGDPGIAVALLAAGRVLGDEAVVREAHETALDAAARTGDGSLVVDAPLCHGAAGAMHLFGRLYAQLGDERLADAGRHWAEVALGMRREGPVAGYGALRADGQGDWEYEPVAGFLEGATGVGLAFLAATSERDPAWDSILLTKPVA